MPVTDQKTQKEEEKVRKKKNVTNNDREWSNLEQYILSQNIAKTQRLYTANKGLFNYFTFRQINGPGPELVNKLRGVDNINVFYRMKTSTLSLMQPKLRLYKVTYEEHKKKIDGTPDEKTLVSLPTPCYKEFKFSDSFGLETAASVQDYLEYESTKPSFRNVGLKSFTMKQDGETHGIVENNIECTLELHFKSLKDLNASPPGEETLRYVDLILWSPARYLKNAESINPHHYEIKALIGYTAPSTQALEGLSLTAEDLRTIQNIEKLNIMLSLGLTDYDIKINDNGSVSLTVNFRGRLETTMGSNQVNVFQDSFRIGEAGNFEVLRTTRPEFNTGQVYKVSSLIKEVHRGLNNKNCVDDSCNARQRAVELAENNKIFQHILKTAYPHVQSTVPSPEGSMPLGITMGPNDSFKVTGHSDWYAWLKEAEHGEKLMAVLKKKIGLFKTEIYKSFVDQLIDGNPTDPEKFGTRLFCAQVGVKDIIKSVGVISDEGDTEGMSTESEGLAWEKKVIEQSTTAVGKGDPSIIMSRSCGDSTASVKKESALELVTAVQGESSSNEQETGETKSDENQKTSLSADQEIYKFYYVYLGDIIELACKNARLGRLSFSDEGDSIYPWDQYIGTTEANTSPNYPLQNARLLVGPIEYLDKDQQIQEINLAQFPISFKFFRAWFFNKIVRRRRAQMPLGEFLAILINDLVRPSLGVGMPKSIKPPRVKSQMVALTLPGQQIAGKTHKICGKEVAEVEEMLPFDRVINTNDTRFKYDYFKKVSAPRSSESMIKTSFDYLLMYMTSAKNITQRSADPLEDIKDGIYHFNIGSDMGLLKNMKFSRVNMEGLAELRDKEREHGGSPERSLGQLKLPYNTDLTLVGSSLFMPGMFYYVNPSLAGLGSVEDASSLAYQMNLGGYHLVLKIATKISPGKFETKITGQQVSQPER